MNVVDSIDLLFGVGMGWYLHSRYYRPVLPIKVTQLSEVEIEPYKKWSDMVEPHVRRLTVAGALGYSYTFNPVGAAAMGKMIKNMAEALDFAVTNHMMKPGQKLTTKR